MNILLKKTYSYTKLLLVTTIIFGLLAGAAMSLQPTVDNTGVGIAAWVISFIVLAISGSEFAISHYSKTWASIREGEFGELIRYFVNIGIVIILFTITTVALIIH